MRKKCTCRRPAGIIGSDGSDHQQVAGGSVGVIDLRRQRENGEKTQIRRINADSGNSFPDSGDISLRSGENLTGFDEISQDPVKISLDLREISPESGFFTRFWKIITGFWKFWPGSGNFCRNLEIFRSVRVFRVLEEENQNRPVGIGFWC